MKKILFIVCAGLLIVSLAASTSRIAGESALADSASDAVQTTDAIPAVVTADELQALMRQYMGDGDFENAYLAANRLTELQPDNIDAYFMAADALLTLIEQNEQELTRLFVSGITNAPDSAPQFSKWLKDKGMEGVITLPFISDYTDASRINAVGNTAGNMTNALRDEVWRGGFVTTQAGWLYFSRFTEDCYSIYKMRTDGSENQRLGTVHGYSLNAVGDWLYFANPDDKYKPYRMRTDGSNPEKIADICSSFLSVSGDWAYSDGYGDNIALCRFRTDGSELTALTNYQVISCCVYGDWIYFCKKSMDDGGLLRMRTDGTETQIIVDAIPKNYAITGDTLYYINPNDSYSVMQCGLDGGNPTEVFRADDVVTAMNVSGTTLIVAYGISFDKDGLLLSNFISLVDLQGGKVLNSWEAHTEPLCVGEGCLFYTKDAEGMRWHCMNLETGEDIPME